MSFNVVGSLVVDVPIGEVPAVVGALIAAVPADSTSPVGQITLQVPSPVAGSIRITTNLTAGMSQMDVEALVGAVRAALPADATLGPFSLVGTVAS